MRAASGDDRFETSRCSFTVQHERFRSTLFIKTPPPWIKCIAGIPILSLNVCIW